MATYRRANLAVEAFRSLSSIIVAQGSRFHHSGSPAKFPAPNSRPNLFSSSSSASQRLLCLGLVSGFQSVAGRRVMAFDSNYCSLFHCGGGGGSKYGKVVEIETRSMGVFARLILCFRMISSMYDLGEWEAVPFTHRRHLVMDSRESEMVVGESNLQEIKSSPEAKFLPVSHPDSVRVCAIARGIIEAFKRETISEDEEEMNGRGGSNSQLEDGFKWEILVADDPDPLACCLRGGKMILSTGILEHLKTDAEIATIVGHEVGHAVARHLAERPVTNAWSIVLEVFLSMFEGRDVAEEASIAFFRYPRYQKMEKEADYIGLMLMASAGYDPRVAPRVYEDVVKIVQDFESRTDEEFWSITPLTSTSHPPVEERSRLLARADVMEEAVARYNRGRRLLALKGSTSNG